MAINAAMVAAINATGHLLERHPTTGTRARNKQGQPVNDYDHDACSWCLAGALQVISGKLKVDDEKLFKKAYKVLGLTFQNAAHKWDWSDKNRKQIVEKLKRYDGR